jgi:hypothetical protein
MPTLHTIFDTHHQKNVGEGARRLPLGIRIYAEVEGVRGLYFVSCVSCTVRGRGDDGVGVFGPQVQIPFSTTSDSVRFSTFGKTLFENEIYGIAKAKNLL